MGTSCIRDLGFCSGCEEHYDLAGHHTCIQIIHSFEHHFLMHAFICLIIYSSAYPYIQQGFQLLPFQVFHFHDNNAALQYMLSPFVNNG